MSFSLGLVNSQVDFSNAIIEKTSISSKYSEIATSYRDGYLYYYKSLDAKKITNNEFNLLRVKIDKLKTEGRAIEINDDLNTRYSEGQISFDKSNKLVYVTRNAYTKEEMKKNGKDSNPLELIIYEEVGDSYVFKNKFIQSDTNSSVGYPCYSELTKRLYFSTKTDDGVGGYDLYYCRLDPNGKFGEKVSLGPKINGKGDDLYPTVKQGVLYYSSYNKDKYQSDLDVFYITELGIDKGELPKRLPEKINSKGDDYGLQFINGQAGYLTSNREEYPIQESDIYYFDFGAPIINEDEFNILLALNKKKTSKLNEYNFKVVDKNSNEELSKIIVSDGIIVENVKEGRVYQLWFDEALDFETLEIGPYTKLVPGDVFKEEKIEIKEVVKVPKNEIDSVSISNTSNDIINSFEDVYFHFDSFKLTPIAKKTLDKFVIEYKDVIVASLIKFEITGYTDNAGDKDYNKNLSKLRAESVKSYLVSKGFKREAIVIKAGGVKRGKSSNKNKRVVEFTRYL